MYSDAFQEHFLRPRGQGDLADATHRGESTDPACGDHVALSLRVESGRVAACRYRVAGCAGAIAAGSALVTLLPGRPAASDAVSEAELDAELGGMPRMKRHALRLVRAALAAALAAGRS